jgi:hypothetical protein
VKEERQGRKIASKEMKEEGKGNEGRKGRKERKALKKHFGKECMNEGRKEG